MFDDKAVPSVRAFLRFGVANLRIYRGCSPMNGRIALAGLLWVAVTVVAAEPPLATAVVERHTVPQERILEGRVEAVNQSTVSAQTSGRVVDVLVDVDDFVPKDAVILRLTGTEQQAGVTQAEAELADARGRLTEATRRFERARALFAEAAASRADYDAAQANLETARARLQSAEAALSRAREQAGYTLVRAPYGGVVTERHVQPGETVVPGQPLLTGFSLDTLRVRVEVPQRSVHAIRTYRQARVLVESPEASSIEVAELTVFPHANIGNTVTVRALLPAGVPGLYPGMLVKVAFTVGERQPLVVPGRAIVYRSEVVGVYTVAATGRVDFRHIRSGRRIGEDRVEVLAGLDAGERVALDPNQAALLVTRAGKP